MTAVEYKVRFMACPMCQNRLNAEFPRIGPAVVACGHCGQLVRTSLPSWAELTTWQKIKVTLGELLVPRVHGEMGCFLGCLTWLLAPLCVIVPIGLLGMFIRPLGTLLSAENGNPVWVAPMIFVPWLFVPAFRTAVLVRKARASNNPLPPTWRA